MILRTVRAYALEWHYRYCEGPFVQLRGGGIVPLNRKQQFEYRPGCFDDSIAASRDIPLTMDLNHTTIFARTGDGTLRIESDDVGLLIEADLIDTPLNRELCRMIDAGKVRGWSHNAFTLVRDIQETQIGDVVLKYHQKAQLREVTLVINKWPRAMTRNTPVFLAGGPQAKEVAHV